MPPHDDLERALGAADPARGEPTDRPEQELRAEAAALMAAEPHERSRRARRPPVRRVATATGTLVVATALTFTLLLAGREQDDVPQRLGVLEALADELQAPGRILHSLARSRMFAPDGRPKGPVTESEQWMLLDDVRYDRFRIERGGEELVDAMSTPRASRQYERATNTVTIQPVESRGPIPMRELRTERLARGAATGRIPIEDHVTIRGRPALKVRDHDMSLYFDAHQPRILRQEIMRPAGGMLRIDFLVFEFLPATRENRRLLRIHPPPDATVRTEMAPPEPKGGQRQP